MSADLTIVAASAAPSRIPAIEGLRGLSAMLVVAFHVYAMAMTGGFYPTIDARSPLHGVELLGGFGVASFFIISGYLITRSLRADPRPASFLRRRALRLYPLFVPLHVLAFTVGPWLGEPWLRALRGAPSRWALHFLTNLFFLPGVFELPIAQKTAWSLSWEAAFYLLAAIVCVALAWRERARPLALLLFGLVAIAAAALLWRSLVGAFFVVGIGCAFTPARLIERLPSRGVATLLGALAYVGAFACYRVAPPLAIAPLGLAFVTLVPGRGLLARGLSTAPLQFLGRISYSLYLVHPFVLLPGKMLLARHPELVASPGARLLAFGLAGGALSIAVAYLAWRALEVELTRRIARSLPRAHREGRWNGCASPT